VLQNNKYSVQERQTDEHGHHKVSFSKDLGTTI